MIWQHEEDLAFGFSHEGADTGTFGENIGSSHCRVPTGGIHWHPTRPPVALDLWATGPVYDCEACLADLWSTLAPRQVREAALKIATVCARAKR